MNESGGRDGRRFTSSRERDVVVLQRERKFYRVAFRKKVYRSIGEMQADLDTWIKE